MSDFHQPLISVGMPLRNEGQFLEQSLQALVAQQDVRFEIIISDNASTDATADICLEYQQRHPHLIRYLKLQENIGASANFARVLQEAKGEFFIWASGHDLWDKHYLATCSKALQAYPAAMIAFGTPQWIDAQGLPFPRHASWSDTRGMSLVARYFTVFWGSMNPVISLIRAGALKEQEISDMVGLDLCILLALSLKGEFMHCTETSWSRREFRTETNYSVKLQRYRSTEYALGKGWLARYFPLARLPLRIFRDLFQSDISLADKLVITSILLPSIPMKYLVDRHGRKKGAEPVQSQQ